MCLICFFYKCTYYNCILKVIKFPFLYFYNEQVLVNTMYFKICDKMFNIHFRKKIAFIIGYILITLQFLNKINY